MNNSNEPTNDPVNSTPAQPNFPPAGASAPAGVPAKKSPDWRKIGVTAAATIIVISLIAGAYILGQKQSETTAAQSTTTPDTSSASDTKPAEETEETTLQETADSYSGWTTYAHPTLGYSFKYPSDWQVDRNIIQDPADWVSVNPVGEVGSSKGDVLAFFTYFDGAGCPDTTTKEFTVGDQVVVGTACAGTTVYKMTINPSKKVSYTGHGVVLARAAQNMVGIQVDMGRGEDETIDRILKSVTGLPLSDK